MIPLGDLWDVVAHGDEAFTDVMRVNFENAKNLYQNKLLPMLEQQHEIDLEVDQGTGQDEHRVAEKLQRFENDDRLVKSLLLVRPGPRRRVTEEHDLHEAGGTEPRHDSLSHSGPGTSGRGPISSAPGRASWARFESGEEPTNPTVSLQLSGVDTESIIESAKTLR